MSYGVAILRDRFCQYEFLSCLSYISPSLVHVCRGIRQVPLPEGGGAGQNKPVQWKTEPAKSTLQDPPHFRSSRGIPEVAYLHIRQHPECIRECPNQWRGDADSEDAVLHEPSAILPTIRSSRVFFLVSFILCPAAPARFLLGIVHQVIVSGAIAGVSLLYKVMFRETLMLIIVAGILLAVAGVVPIQVAVSRPGTGNRQTEGSRYRSSSSAISVLLSAKSMKHARHSVMAQTA